MWTSNLSCFISCFFFHLLKNPLLTEERHVCLVCVAILIMSKVCKNYVCLHSLFHPTFSKQPPLLHFALTKEASALVQHNMFASAIAVISVCVCVWAVYKVAREGVRVNLCEPVSALARWAWTTGGAVPGRVVLAWWHDFVLIDQATSEGDLAPPRSPLQ